MDVNSEAVLAFDLFCKEAGWQKVIASLHEDMMHHTDYHVKINGRVRRVELKGRKEFVKGCFNRERFLIEFKNVNGDDGWIYGKADLIAFLTDGGFIIVERYPLMALMEELLIVEIDGEERVAPLCNMTTLKGGLPPLWYGREGRLDGMTYLTRDQVMKTIGFSGEHRDCIGFHPFDLSKLCKQISV